MEEEFKITLDPSPAICCVAFLQDQAAPLKFSYFDVMVLLYGELLLGSRKIFQTAL